VAVAEVAVAEEVVAAAVVKEEEEVVVVASAPFSIRACHWRLAHIR
jgi:hypothetical protein